MRVNKVFLRIVLLLQTILLISCNDKEDTNKIILSETSISTYEDNIYPVSVKGGSGNYFVEIDPFGFAEVGIEKDGSDYILMIKTRWIGEAIITVTDKETGEYATCSLTVLQRMGTYTLASIHHGIDADQKEAIEGDLQKNDPFPMGSTIIFDTGTGNTNQWKILSPDQSELVNGTILSLNGEDTPESFKLVPIDFQIQGHSRYTFNLNNKEYIYHIFLVRGTINKSYLSDDIHIRFYEDLTEYYKEKYPEAGVKGVVRAQFFNYIREK